MEPQIKQENSTPPTETEVCHNCKREVPQQNYVMHVAHCTRNLSTCPICHEAVARARLQEHHARHHQQAPCPNCRQGVAPKDLSRHLNTECPRRLTACQHCELELMQDELVEHEYHCGARTERCEDCGELVMLKYQHLHRESNHGFLKLSDEPGPTPSWETSSTKSKQTKNGFEDMKPLKCALDNCDSGAGRRSSGEVPPRDLPRTFVPAYDASDDLRAKVNLARHDLKNIKNSVLAGEERVRELTSLVRAPAPVPDLPATRRRPPPAFRTSLVPWEPHRSHQVNARPLGESPTPKQGLFNYLGAPASSLEPLQPLPPLKPALPNGNVSEKKHGGSKTASGNNRGAVPRTHKKTKAPAPPPPTLAKPPSPEISLPCEFCNEKISSAQLILHQTACRPDLAQLKTPREEAVARAEPPSPEVQLPCEFCSSLIPASKLLSHQALCDM